MTITIELLNDAGEVLCEQSGSQSANLVFDRDYAPGDQVRIHAGEAVHLHVTMDAAVPAALVYLATGEMIYEIPFGEARKAYAPQAFAGTRHLVAVRMATPRELEHYRNVALNPLDQPGASGVYPHIHANAETRGESVFAARNAIDGILANHGHGEWPYGSWGVDIQFDAHITLDFGRPVAVDAMGICLRADFPHDSWWTGATLVLSDGSVQKFSLKKTDAVQRIEIGDHVIPWARIEKWVKKQEPAEFPALIQWEMYGRDVR